MKNIKWFFLVLPIVTVLTAGCAGYKGGMEEQTGGAESADSEYTDFAAKGIRAPGGADASKIGMQDVATQPPVTVTPVPPGDLETSPAPEWKQVATGSFHTCAISAKDGGSLWCWGANDHGQLGPFFSGERSNKPVRIGTDANWKYVTAGENHICAIKGESRRLYCWGANGLGQLGDGTYIDKNRPVQVTDEDGWFVVEAGLTHTCAIKEDGLYYCWGGNGAGQVGVDKSVYGLKVNEPVSRGHNYLAKAIAAGGDHTCAISMNDKLWCWGGGGSGQLGRGTMSSTFNEETPVPLPEAAGLVNTWKHVTAGLDHTCGIKTDDTLWCWGGNVFGELGDGTKVQKYLPVEVLPGSKWLAVSAGGEWTYDPFTCGIDKDLKLYCWGGNMFGQLGFLLALSPSHLRGGAMIPTRVSSVDVPTQVTLAASAVSAGGSHACAMAQDGKLYCWGWNAAGQLGDGTFESRNIPTPVVSPLIISRPVGPMSTP